MDFTMHFFKKINLATGLVVLLCFQVSWAAQAGHIKLVHINESQQGNQLLIDAQGEIKLPASLVEALDKGISLYFRTEIEVRRTKTGLMAWHQPLITRMDYLTELAYSRFYQRFTLINQRNGNIRHFQSLDQALITLTRLQNLPLMPIQQLHPGLDYQIRLRFSLDYWQLSAPLLTHAFFNADWRLSSRWLKTPIKLGRL